MGAARTHRVAVLPGDGIGVETTREAVRVLAGLADRGLVSLALTELPWSAERFLSTGEAVPEGALQALGRDQDAVLAGAFGDPRVPDMRHAEAILLGLRRTLDLYANVRPVRCLDERLCPLKGRRAEDVDLVVVRENTEGAYCGLGGRFRRGTPEEVAIEEDVSTRRGVARLVRFGFELARTLDRPRRLGRAPRVTLADKHNVQRFGGALWHEVFRETAREFPDCEAAHLYADTLAHALVRDPSPFDVIVTNNLLGDVLSDLTAALSGGLGLAPSANVHPGRTSLFEPVHGSAPDLSGRGLANPLGSILSAALMLRHLGEPEAAARVEAAVAGCVASGETTPDLGGTLTTSDAGSAVCARL